MPISLLAYDKAIDHTAMGTVNLLRENNIAFIYD
jgi:hypothetical protein